MSVRVQEAPFFSIASISARMRRSLKSPGVYFWMAEVSELSVFSEGAVADSLAAFLMLTASVAAAGTIANRASGEEYFRVRRVSKRSKEMTS